MEVRRNPFEPDPVAPDDRNLQRAGLQNRQDFRHHHIRSDNQGIGRCALQQPFRSGLPLPSPIQISCDLESIDDFTLSLLSNEEILALNQDELGRGAVCVGEEIGRDSAGNVQRHVKVYRRRLSGNREALGFFNLKEGMETISCGGTKGRAVRDLWACRDLGTAGEALSFKVPVHGYQIVQLS